MEPKYCFLVLLLSLCSLSTAHALASSNETTITAETPLGRLQREFVPPCYIEHSKVAELLIRINQTIQILNPRDKYLECSDEVQRIKVDLDTRVFEVCGVERLQGIQNDLSDVSGKLIQLATSETEPSADQINILDLNKFQLIDNIKALRVFYGPSPCSSSPSSLFLFPMDPLIEYLEWNLDQKLALFQTPRPLSRPSLPIMEATGKITRPKATYDQMLNPEKSFDELSEMALSNPSAMSRAIYQIVSRSYTGRASTLSNLLTFIQGLPTAKNRIFGLSALYDQRSKGRQEDLEQLLTLAENVKLLHESTSASSNLIGSAAMTRLTDLILDLSPFSLTGDKAECHVTNVAYGTQLAANNWGFPYSAYVFREQRSQELLRIHPRLQGHKIFFSIQRGDWPLYASDSNPNNDGRNSKYTTKSPERHVLAHYQPPAGAESDWELLPVGDRVGEVKIVSADTGDVMFAHKNATGYEGWRRVLLGRKGSSTKYDHIDNGDLWSLDCKHANYTVPSV